jgi:DNA-binding NtrC family response regulator
VNLGIDFMPTDAEPASSLRHRVLLVDDEPAILMTTEAILEEHYTVTTAESANEALALLATRDFDVVCADYAMGTGMNGVDLLRRVASMSTIVGRVLITGQHNVGESASLCYVLMKPYEPQRLLEVVDRAAAQAMSRRRIAGTLSDARKSASMGTRAVARAPITEPHKRRT